MVNIEKLTKLKSDLESEYVNYDDSILILNEWQKQISQYDKLKLSDAKKLSRKGLESDDKTVKKLYMEKVILGTLYVVYNYITKNNLFIFSANAYDINDIISSFVEVWIKKIYAGELLNVDKYSSIFNRLYFNEVYQSLVDKDIIIYETFDISTEVLEKLFFNFIQFKNRGLKFTYNDLIKSISKDDDDYLYLVAGYSSTIMLMFENIYNNLNYNKDEDLEVGITKIKYFLKVFIDIGITESLSNNLVDNDDMETYVINKILFESFVKEVDKSFENERQKQIIHQIYGLDDGIPKTLEEVAKIHNITRERVRQIEVKCLRRLRHPTRNIKRYI